MIKIHPLRHDNGEYYPQLVYIPVSTSHLIPPTQLTSRKAEVTQIHGWDQHTGFVYYTSTEEDRPGERHLFRLNVTSPHRRPEELTDSILCKYSRIHMAKDLSSYVQECLGPDVPWVKYKTLPDNWPRFWLDKNEKVLNQIAYSSMPRNLFTSVQLPGTTTSARVQLILPPVLRETEDFMFPLIVNLYGGPGSQTVDERWSVGWHTYLASNRDFIVANIDVRGSGYQGLSTKHSVSGQLGTLEASDVLHTVRELIKMYKFIDESKVCVWGWSFGGFLTARVLALDGENSMQGKESVFSCGIAVAPVAQWQDYDSAYTEKYMGLPSPGNNWKGYLEASLTNQAENIADNKFMVLHGTGDDNVHVHHTMVLSKELVKHQIIFRQQLYPDESHGLFGVIKHQHLTMETFLDQIFGPIEDHFRDDYYLAAAILVQDLNLENKENEES